MEFLYAPLGMLIPNVVAVALKGIKLLEGVQRRSTNFIEGLQDIENEERAQLLNLDSLSCRMGKGDMILV